MFEGRLDIFLFLFLLVLGQNEAVYEVGLLELLLCAFRVDYFYEDFEFVLGKWDLD